MADQKKNPDQTPLASDSAQRLSKDQLGLVAEAKRHIHEAIEHLCFSVSEHNPDAESAVLTLTAGFASLTALEGFDSSDTETAEAGAAS